MREIIGMDIPLATDHFGHIGVNSCIRLAKAMEKHNLAWMEDMVPWQLPNLLKMIKDAVDVPILTGEDIYLKEDFIKLIDYGAVDMIHPDLATSGGILETKKIGDYAMERGVPHGDALRGLADLVHGERPLRRRHRELHRPRAPLARRAVVGRPRHAARSRSTRASRSCPTAPASASSRTPRWSRQHLAEPGYFEPTPEWDKEHSWDRLWS